MKKILKERHFLAFCREMQELIKINWRKFLLIDVRNFILPKIRAEKFLRNSTCWIPTSSVIPINELKQSHKMALKIENAKFRKFALEFLKNIKISLNQELWNTFGWRIFSFTTFCVNTTHFLTSFHQLVMEFNFLRFWNIISF